VLKICDNVGRTAFAELDEQRKSFVGLTIKAPDPDGDEDEIDNPAIYTNQGYEGHSPGWLGKWFRLADQEDTAILNQLLVPLDKDGITRPKTWAEIGAALGKPTTSVQKRFSRLKEKVEEQRRSDKERLQTTRWRLQRHGSVARLNAERIATAELVKKSPKDCEVAFEETVTKARQIATSRSSSGLVRAQNHNSANPAGGSPRLRPTLIDFLVDVDLAAFRTLSALEYRQFKSSSEDRNVRRKLGASFIHREIFPPKYFNLDNIDVVFEDQERAA
jgi:hypothetical protein